jgi:hypothetical protein
MQSMLTLTTKRLALFALLLGCFLNGCASPDTAWNSRLGKYTLAQARIDFGKPASEKSLPDGGTTVEWLTNLAGPAPTTGFAGGIRAGGVDQSFNQPMPLQSRKEFLRLDFDNKGILENWSRVYHY